MTQLAQQKPHNFMASAHQAKPRHTLSQTVNHYNKVVSELDALAKQLGKLFKPGEVYTAVAAGKLNQLSKQLNDQAAQLTAGPDNVTSMRYAK